MSRLTPCIRIQGARQHNLKGITCEIPLHRLTVITGLSGSGKSSLAFDTLYAEGQRRYVETFSPYTRQFLERMDKPLVERIDGLPPAIAIEQTNAIKTSRSSVGTMTEIADHLKLLMPRISHLFCPQCQREIRPLAPAEIVKKIRELGNTPIFIGFTVAFPAKTPLKEAAAFVQKEGFQRILHEGTISRVEDFLESQTNAPRTWWIIQDRLNAQDATRVAESVERALFFGKGLVRIRTVSAPEEDLLRFSNRWHCPYDELDFPEPTPALFSFNNPIGACPECRGFGRTIEIDYHLALPDRRLSIAQGVVKPWQTESNAECQQDLIRHCKKRKIPTDRPFQELTAAQQRFIIDGEGGKNESGEELWKRGGWYGVKGFFKWLESKSYKMHVRVLLSRYRAYLPCHVCQGSRFQPTTLHYHLIHPKSGKRNLAQINQMPLREAHTFFETLPLPDQDGATEQLHREIVTRLQYLIEVGLNYLTLDRASRTLSGGEIERVNLTSCLGNSLVHTLFVLDEPSIGLHPRDNHQLVRVLHRLRDRGNTVVVVEHDEAIMEAADHLLDLGPGRGELGGEITFSGSPEALYQSKTSLTGAYLRGDKFIPLPKTRRAPDSEFQLRIQNATTHNLKGIDIQIPLGRFVVLTGVSGSGKSTLLHEVLFPRLQQAIKSNAIEGIEGATFLTEVIRVDQSPLTKTPRSNAALYLGIYDDIRQLFAQTEMAKLEGLTSSSFSFNAGTGRCERCSGTGAERVEMQFLADVFVTCPVCEGKRFHPHTLAIQYRGKSIHDLLETTVHEACEFFSPELSDLTADQPLRHRRIVAALSLLDEVGLGYWRLGQPLNQLSGGEAQRIKLLSYLHGFGTPEAESSITGRGGKTRLFLLDEPTTGLHFEDVRLLLQLFQRMVDQGHSLIVIEHHLDVIKSADWILDLGPEGGNEGGYLVGEGTPEAIAKIPESHTGQFLQSKLEGFRKKSKRVAETAAVPPPPEMIEIRGARHHNLKNLSLDLELGAMTVLTGLSGSGKSTLAFDLLFAEGQRRYLDSLNAYARQFVDQMEKPAVDRITGIPPAVAIEQRITRGGGKSTVATVTEIHQFLRLLYAKLGTAHDPVTGEAAIRQSLTEIFDRIEFKRKKGELSLLAPIIKARKGIHTEVAQWATKKHYPFLRVDGKWIEPSKFKALSRFAEHTIDVILGNLTSRQSPSERRHLIEEALKIGRGTLYTVDTRSRETVYSTQLYCPESGRSFDELDPRLFSFNSPHGWCADCQGFGIVVELKSDAETAVEREVEIEQRQESEERQMGALCPTCLGSRLNPLAQSVRLSLGRWPQKEGPTLPDIGRLSVLQAADYFDSIRLKGRDSVIGRDLLPEIRQRLSFLKEVGLSYLTLNRSATTLSGGESQRIRLASQLGSELHGVLYVLDEPTIGLHPRDNARLLDSLDALKARGNTLVVVEHDEETMKRADRIIDLGPGAGVRGGEIIADGTWKEIAKHEKSITGKLLGTPMPHPFRGERRKPVDWLTIEGATLHNLKNLTVKIPRGGLTVFCGVSGAGKSTLVHEILKPSVEQLLAKKSKKNLPCRRLLGADKIARVVEVDQTPIGKTSRSTPATYLKLMDQLRSLFAQLPLARQRGYSAGRFSFNTKGGRCEACQGQGDLKVEMAFLPTFYVPCDLCRGTRYNSETLQITYQDKSIAEILALSVDEAIPLFEVIPDIRRPLELLREVGLGYLTLGQRSPTLSGGEAQRLKMVSALEESIGLQDRARLRTLATELPQHLYLLEEPTIGLHLADVQKLLGMLHRLVDAGHTVVVIEHHLDVIAEADWVIELGPEGGDKGGKLIAEGTPETVAQSKKSPTAPFLKPLLKTK